MRFRPVEAARNIETYKIFEHKGPELIAQKAADSTDTATLVSSALFAQSLLVSMVFIFMHVISQ